MSISSAAMLSHAGGWTEIAAGAAAGSRTLTTGERRLARVGLPAAVLRVHPSVQMSDSPLVRFRELRATTGVKEDL